MKAYFSNSSGVHIINMQDIDKADAEYFTNNKIKVSLEELSGEVIAYACPFADTSEESEVIVFGNGKPCIEVMHELAELSKKAHKSVL